MESQRCSSLRTSIHSHTCMPITVKGTTTKGTFDMAEVDGTRVVLLIFLGKLLATDSKGIVTHNIWTDKSLVNFLF